MNTAPPKPDSQAQPACSAGGHAALALARMMLDTIARCHEAVLQEESETLVVIRHVLGQLLSASALVQETADGIEEQLKVLLAFAVQTPDQPLDERRLTESVAALSSDVCHAGNGLQQGGAERLAHWFFALSQELNAAHPQAAQLLRWRLQGVDSRQIAARLQMPPRLVRQLFESIGACQSLKAGGVA